MPYNSLEARIGLHALGFPKLNGPIGRRRDYDIQLAVINLGRNDFPNFTLVTVRRFNLCQLWVFSLAKNTFLLDVFGLIVKQFTVGQA